MSIKHGIGVQEGATAISVPIIADSAIPVVIGCAPINLLENPAGAVNTPILANSPAEAMELLGYDDNFASFGLCGMMYVTGCLHQRAGSGEACKNHHRKRTCGYRW